MLFWGLWMSSGSGKKVRRANINSIVPGSVWTSHSYSQTFVGRVKNVFQVLRGTKLKYRSCDEAGKSFHFYGSGTAWDDLRMKRRLVIIDRTSPPTHQPVGSDFLSPPPYQPIMTRPSCPLAHQQIANSLSHSLVSQSGRRDAWTWQRQQQQGNSRRVLLTDEDCVATGERLTASDWP